eukprot:45944_1
MIQKALTYNGYTSKSSRKRSTLRKKRKSKVKRESVLRPSIYQKIQKQRKSQLIQCNNSNSSSSTMASSATPSLPSSYTTLFTSNTTIQSLAKSTKPDHRRTVFISLHGLYDCWRCIPAHILFDAIFILPLSGEWLRCGNPLKHIGYAHDFSDILSDSKFITLLQWKERQGLIFFMLDAMDNAADTLQQRLRYQQDTSHHNVAPFWYHLSTKLQTIYDPDTGASYRPLLLSDRWWSLAYSHMYCSKYNVSSHEILNELHFITMKFKTMQEILYQSNPSMNVVITYNSTPQLMAIQSILRMEPKITQTAPKHEEEEIEIDHETMTAAASFKIQLVNSDDEEMNYLSCDTDLQSPSNDFSSSSHIIKSIMNSGSDSDEDLKDSNYDKASNASSDVADSVSSSALAPIVPFNVIVNGTIDNEKKSFSSQSTAFTGMSRRDTMENVDMEWWVCPDYYYDTYKSKMDTDCDFED